MSLVLIFKLITLLLLINIGSFDNNKCKSQKKEIKIAPINLMIITERTIEPDFLALLQYEINKNNNIGIYIYVNMSIKKEIIDNPNGYYIIDLNAYLNINDGKKRASVVVQSQVVINNTTHVFSNPIIVCYNSFKSQYANSIISELKSFIDIPLNNIIKFDNSITIHNIYQNGNLKGLGNVKKPKDNSNLIVTDRKCGIQYNNSYIDPTKMVDNSDRFLYKPTNNNCSIIFTSGIPNYQLTSDFIPKYNINKIPIINFVILFKIYSEIKELLIEAINKLNENSINFKIDYKFVNNQNEANLIIKKIQINLPVLASAYNDIYHDSISKIEINTRFIPSVDTFIHELLHLLGFSHSEIGIMNAYISSNNIDPIFLNICPNKFYLKTKCLYNFSLNTLPPLPFQIINQKTNPEIVINTNLPTLYSLILNFKPIYIYNNKFDAYDNNFKKGQELKDNSTCLFKSIPKLVNEYKMNYYCTLIIECIYKITTESKGESKFANYGLLNGCYEVSSTINTTSVICCSRGMKINELIEIKK